MKSTLVLIPLLLVLTTGFGLAGEFHPPPEQAGPTPTLIAGQELTEEELGLVRGGTPGNSPPEFNLPRTADIILWDEARTKGSAIIQRTNSGQVVTIHTVRGR